MVCKISTVYKLFFWLFVKYFAGYSVCHTFTMWLIVGTALLLAAAVYTLENNSLDRRIDPYVCAKRKYLIQCSHNYTMLKKFPFSNVWPMPNCICSIFLFHMCNNFVRFITFSYFGIFLSAAKCPHMATVCTHTHPFISKFLISLVK